MLIKVIPIASLSLASFALSQPGLAVLGMTQKQLTEQQQTSQQKPKSGGLSMRRSVGNITDLGNLNPKVLQMGLRAYQCASKRGQAKRDDLLTIVDYSKPSTEKRMWIVDLKHNRVESQQYVAHGSGSGAVKSTQFSNSVNSHKSSIGVFVTGGTYTGKHGLSLRLKGLDHGFNDHASSRAIVMHGANYVSENFIKRVGRLGRSWGCFALDPKKAKKTINELKGGSVIFAYYPNSKWIKQSPYLHC